MNISVKFNNKLNVKLIKLQKTPKRMRLGFDVGGGLRVVVVHRLHVFSEKHYSITISM